MIMLSNCEHFIDRTLWCDFFKFSTLPLWLFTNCSTCAWWFYFMSLICFSYSSVVYFRFRSWVYSILSYFRYINDPKCKFAMKSILPNIRSLFDNSWKEKNTNHFQSLWNLSVIFEKYPSFFLLILEMIFKIIGKPNLLLLSYSF